MESAARPSPTDRLEPTAVAQSSAGLTPFDLQQVTLTRREHIELQHQLSSFRALHGKAVSRMQRMQRTHDSEIGVSRSRIAQLEAELDAAKAQIRDLRQRVFGSKTEHSR
jgi:hypothetical protein